MKDSVTMLCKLIHKFPFFLPRHKMEKTTPRYRAFETGTKADKSR
ncbi:hypothetical protein OIU76_022081 [Salix suchowensis]|nr:hypothetical protein OIU76_022081 [Salix suchowensis]